VTSHRAAYRGFLFLLAALGVGACQIPQPFRTDEISRLTAPGVRAGLTVAPFEGAADGALFAEAVADALVDQDLAATTSPIAGPSYRLTGQAVTEGDAVRLEWTVEDPMRGFAGAIAVGVAPSQMPAWRDGDPRLYRTLAKNTATEIAALLADSTAGTPEQPLILIPEIVGAPGDGRRTLQRSMAYVLDKRGLKVTEQAVPDATPPLVLKGVMKVATRDRRSQIEIAWTLTRPDGTTVGTVAQANEVPAGLLDGPWGDIAFAIADAAADGIADLVTNAPDSAARATR
jgi:hypothetical protein